MKLNTNQFVGNIHSYLYILRRSRYSLKATYIKCMYNELNKLWTVITEVATWVPDNTLGHMVSLYNYQGQNAEGLKSCRDFLTQLIQ
jgi:hypothetical protein